MHQQHCTMPQYPDEIRKLGRRIAGQLHVVWGLTGPAAKLHYVMKNTLLFKSNQKIKGLLRCGGVGVSMVSGVSVHK